MAPTTASSRKRKPTEDMDDSPPKRQTRARAAKASESSAASAPKTTRITTASARIAAEARAAAPKSAPKIIAATATKRKIRVADSKVDAKDKTTEASQARVRTKKPIESVADAENKPRSRIIKAKTAAQKLDEQPKLRTRKTNVEDKIPASEPIVKRTTRARSATMTSEADVNIKEPVAKKVVKRVTFKEDLIDDKENRPISIVSKKDSVKTTGIKAKPVRQPTKTRATVRGKKESKTIEEKLAPLSPKKITQFAKGTSSSEDELVKTPAKKPIKSPVKSNIERRSTPDLISQSPIKASNIEHDMDTLLASPAKRLPQSPFKEALNKSPKKFSMPTLMPELNTTGELSTGQASLRMSPKKFDFTPMRSAAGSIQKIDAATRAALLSSPARRPKSPIKFGSVKLPEKIGAPVSLMNTTSISSQGRDGSLLSASPRKLFSSPTKTRQYSISPVKMPDLTDGTIEVITISEDPTISAAHVQTPFGFQKYSKPVRFAETGDTFEHDVFEESGHYRSIDDASEDELSLGPLTASPSKSRRSVRRLASSPSSVAPTPKSSVEPLTPRPRAKNQFMTPLAVQFGNWLATSPTRSESADNRSTEIYTPVAQVLQNRNGSRGTMTPAAAASTFFEDQLSEVNVAATPENSLQNQDLHLYEDLEMLDEVLSEAGAIAVTPEGLLQQNIVDAHVDIDMSGSDQIDVVKESFEYLPEASADDVPTTDVKSQVLSDVSPRVQLNLTCVEAISEFTSGGSVTQDLDDDTFEEDRTVIINRDLSILDSIPFNEVSESEQTDLPISTDESVCCIFSAEEPQVATLQVTQSVVVEENPLLDEEYGDENSAPKDNVFSEVPLPAVPQKKDLQTPVRAIHTRSKEVRTVARVPLKLASDDSPMQVKVRKARSKSMSAPLTELEVAEDFLASRRQVKPSTESQGQSLQTPAKTPRSVSQPLNAQLEPEDNLISLAGSPFKSVRKGIDAQILRGAVVHVDVHTSEGSDASGIFIELLTQMGARCVKQWNWNSRNTLGGGEDPAMSTKVGITHVIFKDGSKRTLQKVREAKGLVLCVGVGWVLDCERANRWLNEAPFAVDTSTIPRGGHNRRKSMEPRMLANLGGNLVPAVTPIKSTRKSLRLSKAQGSVAPAFGDVDETVLLPFTPGQETSEGVPGSPTTPFLVTSGAILLQQTCPPRQSGQSLFPLSGNLEDQPDERIRERLAKARRKTMEWAPKVGSPLGRGFPRKL